MQNFLWGIFFLLYSASLSATDFAVITIAYGKEYQELVKAGIENKHAYCQKHGYDFIYSEDLEDSSRHIYWSKILLALKTLENSSYKWIVWMDADTLIMNQDILLEDIVDEKNHFLITQDWNGINSGVFFIRNCPWSYQFLKNVYARTDCLSHMWPEQTAIALELKENEEFNSFAKIFPQRVFNSYPPEISWSLNSAYQSGDFILHFASARDDYLKSLFDKYSQLITHDRELLTLDQYLSFYGYQLSPIHSNINEGYMSDEQKDQFKERLSLYPQIKNVLEIGLNAGHSAQNFFDCCKNLEKFVSFDINFHSYTSPAADYFSRKYKQKFQFVEGDSAQTIPQYSQIFPDQKFDLIFIDGGHSYECSFKDILNCQKLAHSNTILWIDDFIYEVEEAARKLIEQGIIEITNVQASSGSQGLRIWAEARYLFPENSKF